MKFICAILCLVALTFAGSHSALGAMPIPSDLKKTVCFVFVEKDGKLIPNGTAFFVGIEKPDKTLQHVYLVTAKHVLQSLPDKGTYFPWFAIRLMRREGGVQQIVIPINLHGVDKTVFIHTDDSVDLAVIPALPKPELFDFKVIPASFLVDKEQFKSLNISEGTDVFFAGMFTPHLGKDKNYPVVRFGRVAMLSDEKIEFRNKQRELYLIETFSFGGNSGAPTFLYLGQDRAPGSLVLGPPDIKLSGVMSGAFLSGFPIKETQTDTSKISWDNMGIAAVVPCFLLSEILLGEELKTRRGY